MNDHPYDFLMALGKMFLGDNHYLYAEGFFYVASVDYARTETERFEARRLMTVCQDLDEAGRCNED